MSDVSNIKYWCWTDRDLCCWREGRPGSGIIAASDTDFKGRVGWIEADIDAVREARCGCAPCGVGGEPGLDLEERHGVAANGGLGPSQLDGAGEELIGVGPDIGLGEGKVSGTVEPGVGACSAPSRDDGLTIFIPSPTQSLAIHRDAASVIEPCGDGEPFYGICSAASRDSGLTIIIGSPT